MMKEQEDGWAYVPRNPQNVKREVGTLSGRLTESVYGCAKGKKMFLRKEYTKFCSPKPGTQRCPSKAVNAN